MNKEESNLLIKLSGVKKVKKPKAHQGKFFRISPELEIRIKEKTRKLDISEGALIRMAINRFLDEEERRDERM